MAARSPARWCCMSRTRRKNNQLSGQFVAHSRELRESPAWRALPDNARRILDRLEVEHMRHGGAENGALPCTYSDFVAAGVRRASVSLAIRQCVALGFLEVTHRGGRSNAEYRNPSRYRLTYLNGRAQAPFGPTSGPVSRATRMHGCAAAGAMLEKPKNAGRASVPGAGRASGTECFTEPDAKAELLSQARKRNSYLYLGEGAEC